MTAAMAGGVTLTTAEPDLPSTVAEMTTLPTAKPRTTPAASTVTDAGLDDDHTGVFPAITALFWSRTSAASVPDAPRSSERELGETTTLVTTGVGGGGGGGLVASPLPPPQPHDSSTATVPAIR